jgi:hypothetical protein
MGCGTHVNAIWCNLFALEMGDLTARPVLYGDVRACWQVGVQCCGGCRHKERDAAKNTVHISGAVIGLLYMACLDGCRHQLHACQGSTL